MRQIEEDLGGRQERLGEANAVGPCCRGGLASTEGSKRACGTEDFARGEVEATGEEGTGGGVERGSS